MYLKWSVFCLIQLNYTKERFASIGVDAERFRDERESATLIGVDHFISTDALRWVHAVCASEASRRQLLLLLSCRYTCVAENMYQL